MPRSLLQFGRHRRGFQVVSPGVPGPPPSPYAIWNPSDKSAEISILTPTSIMKNVSTTTFVSCRTDKFNNAGKWYYEFTASNTQFTNRGGAIGLATSGVSLGSNGLLNSPTSWVYRSMSNEGRLYNNGAFSVVSAISTGTAMVAWDADAGNIWFGLNNSWFSGDPAAGTTPSYTGVTGDLYIIGGCSLMDTTVEIFTGPTLAYSPPTGFNPGFYN